MRWVEGRGVGVHVSPFRKCRTNVFARRRSLIAAKGVSFSLFKKKKKRKKKYYRKRKIIVGVHVGCRYCNKTNRKWGAGNWADIDLHGCWLHTVGRANLRTDLRVERPKCLTLLAGIQLAVWNEAYFAGTLIHFWEEVRSDIEGLSQTFGPPSCQNWNSMNCMKLCKWKFKSPFPKRMISGLPDRKAQKFHSTYFLLEKGTEFLTINLVRPKFIYISNIFGPWEEE